MGRRSQRARHVRSLILVVLVIGCGGETSGDAGGPEDELRSGGAGGRAEPVDVGGTAPGPSTGGDGGAAARGGVEVGGEGATPGGGAGGSLVGGAGPADGGGPGLGGCAGAVAAVDYQDLGTVPQVPGCPVDPSLPDCAASDQGATVARTAECLETSGALHGCEPWPLDDEHSLILLPGSGCVGPTRIHSVDRWWTCPGDDPGFDSSSQLRIVYEQEENCAQCDGIVPTWHAILVADRDLPDDEDGRELPVIAELQDFWPDECLVCPDVDCGSSCPQGYWPEPDGCTLCACAPPELTFQGEELGVTLAAVATDATDRWELELTWSYDAGGDANSMGVRMTLTFPLDLPGPSNRTLFVPDDAATLGIAAVFLPDIGDSRSQDLSPIEGYLSIRREGPRLVGGLLLTLARSDPEAAPLTVGGPFEITAG